eukprot:snap_masked-scaffold_19-processed-gene-4.0-mRNA-1 protein AED:1.00 eAED:1.00 QI:0/-1/0/0/-1/1/1/0/364
MKNANPENYSIYDFLPDTEEQYKEKNNFQYSLTENKKLKYISFFSKPRDQNSGSENKQCENTELKQRKVKNTQVENNLYQSLDKMLSDKGYLKMKLGSERYHLILGRENGKGIPFKRLSQLYRYDFGTNPLCNYFRNSKILLNYPYLYSQMSYEDFLLPSFWIFPGKNEFNRITFQKILNFNSPSEQKIEKEEKTFQKSITWVVKYRTKGHEGVFYDVNEKKLKSLERELRKKCEFLLRVNLEEHLEEVYLLVNSSVECFIYRKEIFTKEIIDAISKLFNVLIPELKNEESVDFKSFQLISVVFGREKGTKKLILVKINPNPKVSPYLQEQFSAAIYQIAIRPILENKKIILRNTDFSKLSILK